MQPTLDRNRNRNRAQSLNQARNPRSTAMNRISSLLAVGIALSIVAVSACFASFVPPAGLELWLRADAGVTTSGSDVTGWADQSGLAGNRDMTNTQGTPTYVSSVVTGSSLVTGGPLTNPAVRFSGSQIMSNSEEHNAQTIFLVSTWALSGVPYTRHGGVNEYVGTVGDGNVYLKNPQTMWDGGASILADGGFHIFSGLYQDPDNGNNGSIYINGILQATGTGGNSPTNLYDEIGARWSVTSHNAYFAGDIAELLVFSTNLTAAQRSAVEGYLLNKYILEIPEPTSLALLGLGGLLILRRRRRTA